MLEVVFVTAFAVLASVGIHYEFLRLAMVLVQQEPSPHRRRVAVAVVIAVAAHLVEVGVFAAAWWWCVSRGIAELTVANPGALDLFYYSGNVYSSLGFGDIVPSGDGRALAVAEAVTGLVLIAWTASFTYLEMRLNWVSGTR